MAYQLVLRWPTGEQTITLDRAMVVGRDPGCDVPIDSVRLSRRHAEFVETPRGVTVRDMGSRNGILVNGSRVEEALVGPADRIVLGDVAVAVLAGRDADATRPPAPAVIPSAAHTSSRVSTAPALTSDPIPVPSASAVSTSAKSGDQTWRGSAAGQASPGRPVFAPGPSDKTMILPAGGMPIPGPAPTASGKATTRLAGTVRRQFGLGGQLILGVLVAAFVMFVVTAIPLVRARSEVVKRTSLARVSTIARALGVENGMALATGQTLGASVQGAMLEPGVREVLLLSPQGRVLAPAERANQTITTLPAFGDLTSVQGVQTVDVGDEVQAVAVIQAGGQRVGLAWVRLDPAYAVAGNPIPLYLAATLVTGLAVATVIGFRLRHAVMSHVATFATDVDLAASGQLAAVTESFGMPKLADSVNFIIDRLRKLPSQAAPRPEVVGPPSPAPVLAREGNLLLDSAFIVTEADASAAQLLRTTREQLKGQHVLTAIAEPALVTAIIDAITDLSTTGESTRRVAGSAGQPDLELRVGRAAPDAPIRVAIRRLG